MKIEEALQFADQFTGLKTHAMRVAIALAAEVRRLQSPAVEAVPFGYVAHDRNVGPRPGNHIITEEEAAEYDSRCITAVYTHPPALDDEPNWNSPKLQALLRKEARLTIILQIYESLIDGETEFNTEYAEPRHYKLLDLMQRRALDDKKHQSLLGENARLSILNHLYNQISDGRTEFSAMDMDYWDSSHDKLLDAMQNKLDDDTRKLVLELCELAENHAVHNPIKWAIKFIKMAKQVKEKLGACDE